MRSAKSDGVAVLGHYGQLNLGDESITAGAIGGVRCWRPDARVIAISLDPADTQERHRVDSYALRRDISRTPLEPPSADVLPAHAPSAPSGVLSMLRRIPLARTAVNALRQLASTTNGVVRDVLSLPRSWRALEGVELMIVAGSNQLLDQFGGAWGFPYTLLRWTILARLRGARVVLLSVGAGPLSGRLACQFIRWTLHLAEYVSVRDEGSAALVRRIGWRPPVPVRPDLAFSFNPSRPSLPAAERTGSEALHVAVNLMPVHDPRWWPDAKPKVQESYLQAVAGFVEWLLAQGHRVDLYGTQPADEWVARDLMARIGQQPAHGALRLARIRSLDDLVELYQRCDVITATRFHGILLALRFARPVIGICYYRKSRELMRDFGLERYAFDLDGVTADQLQSAFSGIVAERTKVEELARRVAAERAAELADQYRLVLVEQTVEAVGA
jgi:polysaccharide pyruvyl transferase WcaK-like protein